MKNYLVRGARQQDMDCVCQIFSLADKLHRNAHPEIFKKSSRPSEIRDYFLAIIRSDDGVIFVSEDEGEIIGAIIALQHESRESSILVKRNFVSVENLVVADEYRERGVGKALMDAVHAWAQNRNIQEIQLTVWDFNQGAIAFYEKLGYRNLHHRMRKELP